MCWEFPCVVPSDWSAQHVQKPNNPDTVRDLKLALDAIVLKQGVFNLVFHPHGWIRTEQIVELIDHAVTKHGKKVKFLTFRECAERLNKNLLEGKSIRTEGGRSYGIALADLDLDGFIDVGIGRHHEEEQKRWNMKERQWLYGSFPFTHRYDNGDADYQAAVYRLSLGVIRNQVAGIHWWSPTYFNSKINRWETQGSTTLTSRWTNGEDPHQVLFRDLDGDGSSEIIDFADDSAVFSISPSGYGKVPFAVPDYNRKSFALDQIENGRFSDIQETACVLSTSTATRNSTAFFRIRVAIASTSSKT